jgi:hypothetical protein
MTGRSELEELARAIGGASDVDRAWAGAGPAMDVRKTCGMCGENQPVRIPFLRHVCRSCTAIWVPGICVDCAHTSVTFTLDGQLSRLATCGCSGVLRQVAYVPKPRAYVAPEIVAAREVQQARVKKQVKGSTRAVMVLLALVAVVTCVRFVRHNDGPAPARETTTSHRVLTDKQSQSMEVRGRLAAARLVKNGRSHDVFSCTTLLPPLQVASAAVAGEGVELSRQAFVAACLAG